MKSSNIIFSHSGMNKITKDFKGVWDSCLRTIIDNVGIEVYDIWFAPIVPLAIEDNTLILQLPSHLYYEFLEEHYVNLLKSVIKKELGQTGKLKYRVVMNSEGDESMMLPSNNRPAVNNPSVLPPIDVYNSSNREIVDPFILPGIQKRKIPSNLVDTLTFENYVEGDCNRLARSAGWAISKAPGATSFNPLFIYSDVGLGKTHLVNAIGIQTKINFPDKTVVYVTSDTFYQQYIEAVKNHNVPNFKVTDKTDNGALGKDAFLQILITQLQNQDPTSPMDDKEFIAQMAQFSSLEQMQNMTKAIEDLLASQKQTQLMNYSTFVGKEVKWHELTDKLDEKGNAISNEGTGQIQELKFIDGEAVFLLEDGKKLKPGNISSILSGSATQSTTPSSSNLFAAASELIGQMVQYSDGDKTVEAMIEAISKSNSGIIEYIVNGKRLKKDDFTVVSQKNNSATETTVE